MFIKQSQVGEKENTMAKTRKPEPVEPCECGTKYDYNLLSFENSQIITPPSMGVGRRLICTRCWNERREIKGTLANRFLVDCIYSV